MRCSFQYSSCNQSIYNWCDENIHSSPQNHTPFTILYLLSFNAVWFIEFIELKILLSFISPKRRMIRKWMKWNENMSFYVYFFSVNSIVDEYLKMFQRQPFVVVNLKQRRGILSLNQSVCSKRCLQPKQRLNDNILFGY